MRHFATESGKSKGQFYTPAEVSRIMAQIIGIGGAQTTNDTTVYDPTCGSGSLLLKVGDEADGQGHALRAGEGSATSGLARMNMILHDNPTALIEQGNTLADPKFKDGERPAQDLRLRGRQPAVFRQALEHRPRPAERPLRPLETFGVPPAKQGDYAYLLHIVRSLKSTGKGACILPHGVLFRGNAEADIRKNLIRKGYIKGIIGLPANLFYGTGIPACIIVIDKEDAQAPQGHLHDRRQQRLHERRPQEPPARAGHPQDRRRVHQAGRQRPKLRAHGRLRRDREERLQPQPAALHRQPAGRRPAGHRRPPARRHPRGRCGCLATLLGGVPQLRQALFTTLRPGYLSTSPWTSRHQKSTIYEHPEFAAFIGRHERPVCRLAATQPRNAQSPAARFHPKHLIVELSEDLLAHYTGQPLIDEYAVYQHLMDYWATTMQDDAYLIAADGWKAETYRVIEKKNKRGQSHQKDKGWACDLVPKR
jgi:type I restriction enzyme M protein